MPNKNRQIVTLPDNVRTRTIAHILLFFLCCPCAFLHSLVFSRAAASENITIYFYSSETNINNFKFLKMEFDQYLSEFGSYEFQPFNDRETFEAQIKDKQNCLVLLSSWHYANIHAQYALTPVLVGSRKGKKYQKRVLVTSGASDDIQSVKAGQIASSSSIQHTRSTLQQMFEKENVAESFKVLVVPKDIDALMSIGFGMAKAALTTDSSLDKLKMMNPVLHKKIHLVAESEEALLLILAVPESFQADAEETIAMIQEMSANPEGKKRLRMLGLDAWQTLDSSDRAKLEK